MATERLAYTAGFQKDYVRNGWNPQLVAQWWEHLAPGIRRTREALRGHRQCFVDTTWWNSLRIHRLLVCP